MSKILPFPKGKSNKKSWFDNLKSRIAEIKAWIIGTILVLAAFTGFLNDGSSFLDRFKNESSAHAKSSMLGDVIINAKPLNIEFSSKYDMYDKKGKEYSIELQSTGNEILVGDDIGIDSIKIEDYNVKGSEYMGIPSIELISGEIEQKYLNKEQSKTQIKVLLNLNFFVLPSVANISSRQFLNIGYFTISVPYKIEGLSKRTSQRIPVLMEVFPRY